MKMSVGGAGNNISVSKPAGSNLMADLDELEEIS